MISRLTLPAPAKLNLFLHVLGRRADGYHQLQTVFQLLDYGDELTITARAHPKVTLQCNIDRLNTTDNLVLRAASLLRDFARVSQGAHIQLDKRLPMGGGLGGGSSDAATTLLGLNQLWQCRLDIEALAELGRQLGADVPVFIRGHSAFGEGVGERLQVIDLPEIYYLVLTPDCAISTAEIFAHPELTRDSTAITVPAFFEQGGRNDCQPLVEKLYPEVKNALSWLSHYTAAQKPRMSGTGASVFASFQSAEAAQSVLAQSPWPGFVARGINQSPVHEILSKHCTNFE